MPLNDSEFTAFKENSSTRFLPSNDDHSDITDDNDDDDDDDSNNNKCSK